LIPWPKGEIQVSGPENAEALDRAFDGNARTFCMFRPLKGSELTVSFSKPRHIGRLGFLQGGWGDWGQPKDLRLTLDDTETVDVRLQLLCGNRAPGIAGRVQAVPLDRTVSNLAVKVTDVYTEGPGLPGMENVMRKQFGGLAGIGEAAFAPVKVDFAERPLHSGHTGVELELKAPEATVAAITGKVFSKRTSYSMPDLSIKPGTHTYRLDFADLAPAHAYGLPGDAIYIRELSISGKDPSVPLEMVSLAYVPELADSDAKWFTLPPFEAPTKEIDGEQWVEGMSYSSAGRFANSTYNGLLNETVMDNWFQVNISGTAKLWNKMQFDMRVEGLSKRERQSTDAAPWHLAVAGAASGDDVESNWVMMKHSRRLKDGGAFTATCGILVPGFLLESDKPIMISSRYGGTLPVRSGAPDEDERRFFTSGSKDEIAAVGPAGILTCNGFVGDASGSIAMADLAEPWVVALWGIADPTFRDDRAGGVLFTFDAGQFEWNKKGVTLPTGTVGVSSAFHGLLPSGWKPEMVSQRARLLTRMLRTYPVACGEWYRVDRDRINIRNELTYRRWGVPEWQAADYAPIPPIVSWAKDSLAWPQLAGLKTTGDTIYTAVGPYRWTPGNTVTYSLPYHEIKTAAFPRRAEYRENCRRMSDEFAARFDADAEQRPRWNAWETFYQGGWMKAILGTSLLEKDARDDLLTYAARNLQLSFHTREWLPRRELFTGIPYVISGWGDRTVTPMMFGDGSSCFGLAGYGLYQYCKYSADWEMARKLWPRMMDMVRYTEVCNDWAVPTTTARESTRFSNIDMDTIGYLGLCGVERMAQVLGHEEDRKRAAYIRAKVGLAAALRMNFNRYLDPEGRLPKLYASGFTEYSAAKEMAATNSMVVRDHIAMMFSWTGEQAEYLHFLMDALSPGFFRSYHTEFLDRHVSDWRDMPGNKSRPATHIAMRAWLDWPARELENDYSIWMKSMGRDVPYPPASFGGMYGVYMNHQEKVFLINWEPARLGTLDYDPETRILNAQLTCPEPFDLRLYSPFAIKNVTVDGRPAGTRPRQHTANTYDLTVPPCEARLRIALE